MPPKDGRNHTSDSGPVIVDLGYRSVIDLLPCYLTIQDPGLRILFSNLNFKKDFGEGIGRLCHEVYKGIQKRCDRCPVQKSLEDKQVHLSEETVRLPSGHMARMIVYSAPILDVAGEVKAVMEMSANISKIAEMGEELKFIGQSVAMLSHDMKNILEGLQGGAYVVDEGIKDGDMALAGKGWEIVKKNITEMTSYVQDILFSAKKRPPEFRKVFPGQIIREVVGLLEERAKDMGISLEYQVNPSLPSVNLDQSVRRLLNNLIWNALEACRSDEKEDYHKVVVRADYFDTHHIKFEVEDNGVGMNEDIGEKLFRGSHSTKKGGGTGLGLLVVDRIVKTHQGRIEVLTAPGKGSLFRVIFRIS